MERNRGDGGEGRIRDRMVRRIGGRERKVRKRKMRGKGEMEVSGRDLRSFTRR